MTRRKAWTWAELELMRWGYADSSTADMATALGRSCSTVYAMARKMGLKKSAAYLESERSGRIQRGRQDPRLVAHRFKPGIVPWNTGTKGLVGVQPECRAAQFKPGRPAHEAHNYVPIGALKVNADGYLVRKVTDDPTLAPVRRWVGVHRLVWVEAHGPIPAGHVVCFKPGRASTELEKITPDALELRTKREVMLSNSVHAQYPKELARLVQLRAVLTRQINRKAKEATTP
jgi:hypothetical protein